MGFVVGAHVVRKGGKTYAEIVGMENEFVLLNLADATDATDATGESHKVHCRSFLKKEWKKYTPKKEVETLSEHEKYYGVHQDEFIQMMIKHRIIEEMHDLGATHSMHDSDLQLEVKPSKGVIALKKYPKGKTDSGTCELQDWMHPRIQVYPHTKHRFRGFGDQRARRKDGFQLGPHISCCLKMMTRDMTLMVFYAHSGSLNFRMTHRK